MSRSSITAFAPATVANVAVGFDVLGFALEGVGDRVTVSRGEEGDPAGIVIDEIGGVVQDLPREPSKNTAAVALKAMLDDLGFHTAFRLSIDKGIPIGAGMGGSAASAVAAVVAANGLLEGPARKDALLRYALAGEAAASGAPHADNAAPCLYGGLTAVLASNPPQVVPLAVPEQIRCVLVHPRLRVDTREARSVLRREVSLEEHVAQSSHLAVFVAACCQGDLELIRKSMRDLLVEPQRSSLIPGFGRVRAEAFRHGALGCSIAGSGPSVFAWIDSQERAEELAAALVVSFKEEGVQADAWVSKVNAPGARVV